MFHCSNGPILNAQLGPHRLQDVASPGEMWSSVKILITITSARCCESLGFFFFLYHAVPLGSIQELPAESCGEIKASEGNQRWLTGITGYTLMGMVRQSWLAVKVRPFSLSIKCIWINAVVLSKKVINEWIINAYITDWSINDSILPWVFCLSPLLWYHLENMISSLRLSQELIRK